MKISILFTEGAKQVMMTPETDHEREALKLIAPDDVLRAVSKWGSFGPKDHARYEIAQCAGNYYRPFSDQESLMFVIKATEQPKTKD